MMSARRVALNVWSATARRVSRALQRVAASLPLFFGSAPPSLDDDHPIQEGYGDKGAKSDFWESHARLLMVVRYGRGARVIDHRAAECEVGHTSLRLFAAANRHLRAFWERLVAEEAQHRSIGFFLR